MKGKSIRPASQNQSVAKENGKAPPLTAVNLKQALWETLHAIKHEGMLPGQADAIAAQAREILRTVKTQLQIAQQGKHSVPYDVIDFAQK